MKKTLLGLILTVSTTAYAAEINYDSGKPGLLMDSEQLSQIALPVVNKPEAQTCQSSWVTQDRREVTVNAGSPLTLDPIELHSQAYRRDCCDNSRPECAPRIVSAWNNFINVRFDRRNLNAGETEKLILTMDGPYTDARVEQGIYKYRVTFTPVYEGYFGNDLFVFTPDGMNKMPVGIDFTYGTAEYTFGNSALVSEPLELQSREMITECNNSGGPAGQICTTRPGKTYRAAIVLERRPSSGNAVPETFRVRMTGPMVSAYPVKAQNDYKITAFDEETPGVIDGQIHKRFVFTSK